MGNVKRFALGLTIITNLNIATLVTIPFPGRLYNQVNLFAEYLPELALKRCVRRLALYYHETQLEPARTRTGVVPNE